MRKYHNLEVTFLSKKFLNNNSITGDNNSITSKTFPKKEKPP